MGLERGSDDFRPLQWQKWWLAGLHWALSGCPEKTGLTVESSYKCKMKMKNKVSSTVEQVERVDPQNSRLQLELRLPDPPGRKSPGKSKPFR